MSTQSSATPAIEVDGVSKRFGATVALDDVNLRAEPGEVVGLLGPNGAGKTTLVRVLATLLTPDRGSARIFGHDVTREAHVVRSLISLTGQYAAVDGLLTGRENLLLFADLLNLRRPAARRRADELLARFDLTEAADRPARGYSGGMRRRLDLASSLLIPPQLLFLDEPTTGLDPRTRTGMWDIIRELVAEGTTLLLTTQYLEEADVLADRIVVIDHGRIIADGTGDELKDRAGGVAVRVILQSSDDRPRVVEVLRAARLHVATGDAGPEETGPEVTVETNADDGLATMEQVIDALRDGGVSVKDLGLRRPTLDDVFLDLTGRPAPADGPDEADIDDEATRDEAAAQRPRGGAAA